jgi:N-methylhydantoinase A
MHVSEQLAENAIREKVARKFGWSVEEAAEGIIRLAVANMTNAIRLISVQKGYDPRDFLMVAYGGAGPVHASEVARELRIPHVAVTPLPGYASAFGASRLDVRQDFSQSILKVESELHVSALEEVFNRLEEKAAKIFQESKIALQSTKTERFADVRYYDQTNSLTVPVPLGKLNEANIRAIKESFLAEHKRRFGYVMPEGYAEIEFVNARITMSGESRKPTLEARKSRTIEDATKGSRKVYFKKGGFVETPVYERLSLPAEAKLVGPAILEQPDSTVVIQPEDEFTLDKYSNVMIRLKY